MPLKYGAKLGRFKKAAIANQKKQTAEALADPDTFYGKVIRINMARCVVRVWDHKKKTHEEVQARLPNKHKGYIKTNDVVLIVPSSPDWEVQVSIVDRKAIKELVRTKRLSEELAAEGALNDIDTGVVFEEDDEAEDGFAIGGDDADDLAAKKRKDALVEDVDVEIDDI